MGSDAMVRDYLGRLEVAASSLPVDRRTELVGDVREHIEVALSEADPGDQVAVRNILERLGTPEEIVAAEASPTPPSTGSAAPAPATATAQPGIGPVEILGILFLTAGAVLLPFIGPLIGVVFVWLSRRWTTRWKWIATGIAVVLMLVPIVGLMAVGTSSAPPVGAPIPAMTP